MPREPSPACSAGGESPSAGACLQGDEPMRRCPQVLLILGLCLSVPAAAHAACAPTPIDECSSARPAADFFALRARCLAKAAAERAAATPTCASGTPAAQSVFAARNTVASLNFSNVPTWTDADILAQFASTRDKRYITDSFDASPNPRRITWMYPQDGCFDRAEQVDDLVAQAGKVRPYKLFAFGNSPFLRAYTNNDSSGVVSWTFHVVPIVKNSAGQPIVFDAALSPCRPLPYKDWLALLVDSMSSYDDIGSGNGVP